MFHCCSASPASVNTGTSCSDLAIPGDSRLGFAPRLVRGESDATPDPVMGLEAGEEDVVLGGDGLGEVIGDFDAS